MYDIIELDDVLRVRFPQRDENWRRLVKNYFVAIQMNKPNSILKLSNVFSNDGIFYIDEAKYMMWFQRINMRPDEPDKEHYKVTRCI